VTGRETTHGDYRAREKMNPKQRSTHRHYIEILRKMTPEQRLLKAFELSDRAKRIFLQELREKHPGVSEEEFTRILRERLLEMSQRKLAIYRSINKGSVEQ
jgi:hypothetical protein